MKSTGKFHPILGHEIMQLEESDIKFWHKDWKDLTIDEKANYCNYKNILFLSKDNELNVEALYISDSFKNRI